MTNDKTPSLNIFLCHANEDKPKVRELFRRLKSDGHNVWFDEDALVPGQNWKLEIHNAMRSADVIIYCLSTVSVKKSGYVQVEYKEAKGIAQEKPEGSIFIIPLKLDDCSVPEAIQDLQWANYFEDGYTALKKSLAICNEGKKAAQGIYISKLEKNAKDRIEQKETEQSKKKTSNLFFRSNIPNGLVLTIIMLLAFKEIIPFIQPFVSIYPTTIQVVMPTPAVTSTVTPTQWRTATAVSLPSKTSTQRPSLTPVFSISPISPNHPPEANGQAVITQEDTPIDITLTGSDSEESVLTFFVVDAPFHGKLTGNNSKVTYVPDRNYNGKDAFTFAVSDGNLYSPPATVDIMVTVVNDVPVAIGETYSVAEDTVLNVPAPGLLGNDTDINGDLLTATETTAPTHGKLAFHPDGSFVYEPFADYNGPDRFIYQVTDGSLVSSIAFVNITVEPVNDAPICTSFSFDTSETDGEITPSCSEKDENPLTLVIVSPPIHGTVSVEGNKFHYIPNTDYHGSDSFAFVASDGSANSNNTTISISNNLPQKPILVEPVVDTTLLQPILPDQWIFIWQAAPDPCHSIITINDPDGQFLSDSVYSSTGRHYEYVYSQATPISNSKLTPWSWQVTVVCPFARNTSDTSKFSVTQAPFDWERFGQNVGNLIALLGILFTIIYVLGLIPFVLYFEKMARILDVNPSIARLLANIEYFNWLEAVFRLIDTYQLNNIKRKSESAKQIAIKYSELDSLSRELKNTIEGGDREKVDALVLRSENLLGDLERYNSDLKIQVIDLETRFEVVYQQLKIWRQD